MTEDRVRPSIECPSPQLPPGAQGIARVAVDDSAVRLIVTFSRPIRMPEQSYLFNPRSYSLTGGQRLFPRILSAEPYNPTSPPQLSNQVVSLKLDGMGDFSVYTLTVTGPDIDPFFSSRRLRFRLACDDRFDCRFPSTAPLRESEMPILIDYLAKDYASFRQALLDFIPTRLRTWSERSEADIGMMLLELFAASADTLSYVQDRVANEAFLNSATQRRSVAGHLALIGYQMDEGASAYTWLQFQVNEPHPLLARAQVSNKPNSEGEPLTVFETFREALLDPRHNEMFLYTWSNEDCCLPHGALSTALRGSFEDLNAGDYLLIDDGRGHRDVIRLTVPPKVLQADAIASPPGTFSAMGSPPAGYVTIVRWSEATPLHYDYCVPDVIVRGNLVLATHGETVTGEDLRALKSEERQVLEAEIAARTPGQRLPRQRLRLAKTPLAHLDATTVALAEPLATMDSRPPQKALLTSRPLRGRSELQIQVEGYPGVWREQTTLLESRPDEQVFRVEINDQGEATVVFGDGTFGARPPETARVTATEYRVGGGKVGNVGADTLILLLDPPPWLLSVTNPLPAVGGRDIESRDRARRFGPPTSHESLVAVSASDYQAAAQGLRDAHEQLIIQRAKAAFQWTGSWLTVTLGVDPRGIEGLTPDLRHTLLDYLETRRLTGYDLEIIGPEYVPIDLTIEFCVAPGFRASDVQQALTQALSNAGLPDGRKGLFHPDNFSFGDNLYVSRIYATVMSVPGIESAQIKRLARLHAPQPERQTETNLRQGFLSVGSDQIIRLDNDRNFPQNGVLGLEPKGTGL